MDYWTCMMLLMIVSSIYNKAQAREIFFVKAGSSFILKCPIKSVLNSIVWRGPQDLMIYSISTELNEDVENFNITGDTMVGEFNLLIPHYSYGNEGHYQCEALMNGIPVVHNIYLKTEEGVVPNSGISFPFFTSGVTVLPIMNMSYSTTSYNTNIYPIKLKILYAIAAGLGVILMIFATFIIQRTLNRKQSPSANHNEQTIGGRRMESANEENPDNESTVNDYEEIDNVSYHSVTWRNYNFESDDRPNTHSDTESISVHPYINTYISNTYEDLDNSNPHTHKYETINKV